MKNFLNSFSRIKYMAFYISKSDHQMARQIAHRALEKIHFREESERLNVYLALFNMEISLKNDEAAEKVYKVIQLSKNLLFTVIYVVL